ncbi:winged helix-turn-helix domain-containing protein [Phormidium tenue FACHB-886]|nr:winged helix-turn-helix domain-containing protein [Phormidium tenue FACHB-886]
MVPKRPVHQVFSQEFAPSVLSELALWTRESVGQLLEQRYGVSVSVWTVRRYLKQWGLTAQRSLRRTYEQDAKAVKQWLEVEYPTIVKLAKQEGTQIH